MSWPDSVRAMLPARRRLAVLLAPGGISWRECAAHGLPWGDVERGVAPAAPAQGRPAWEAALAACAGLLERRGGRRSLEVLLGGPLVRWQLLPCPRGVSGRRERLAYAEHRFQEIYGDAARQWSIAFADVPPGEPLVAAAVDKALATGVRELAARGRHRLEALGPAFSRVFDRHRGSLPRRCHLFALVEAGRLTCARLDGGRWQALRGGAWDAAGPPAGWQGPLADLARETDLASIAGTPVRSPESIFLCGVDTAPESLAGIPVRRLALPANWPA